MDEPGKADPLMPDDTPLPLMLIDLTTPEAIAHMDGMVRGMDFARREKCYDDGHAWSESGMGWPMRWTRFCFQCLSSEPCAEPPGLMGRRIG